MTNFFNGQAPAQPVREQFNPGLTRRLTDQAHGACDPANGVQGAAAPMRILLINGAPRCDGSWTGDAAMTWRLTDLARATLADEGIDTEILDLGLLPEAADLHDALATIRAQWAAAHGIIVFSPTDWRATRAMLEAVFPPQAVNRVLEGAYGIVVHGQATGMADARSSLADWFDGLGLVDSDSFGPLTHYAGYTDDETLDAIELDAPLAPDYEEQARNVARAVQKAVTDLRAGRLAGVKPAAR